MMWHDDVSWTEDKEKENLQRVWVYATAERKWWWCKCEGRLT